MMIVAMTGSHASNHNNSESQTPKVKSCQCDVAMNFQLLIYYITIKTHTIKTMIKCWLL